MENNNQENKFKIGIDLDDTLLDFINPFLKFLKENHDHDYSYEDWTEYYFSRKFDIPHSEALKILEGFFASEKFEDLELLPHAKEAINELWKEFELNFITARPQVHTQEKTQINLNKHFPQLNYGLIFSGEHNNTKEKHEICDEKDIKLIVEDHKKNALVYAEAGLRVILFERPWNQEVKHDNIIRIQNWKQAVEEIKKFFRDLNSGDKNKN